MSDLPTWATPQQIAAAEASLRRSDKDVAELRQVAAMLASGPGDERLRRQLFLALHSAYWRGRRAEFEEQITPHRSPLPPGSRSRSRPTEP